MGNRIACIGGIDQYSTLTAGTTGEIREMTHKLFDTVGKDGGYVCSASDHFFEPHPKTWWPSPMLQRNVPTN